MPPSPPPIRAASVTDLSLLRSLFRADSFRLHRPLSSALLLRLASPPVTADPLQPRLSSFPFKRRPAASSALLPPLAPTGTTPPLLRSSPAGTTPPHYPLASPSHADKSNSRLLWMKRGHQRSEGILGLLQQSRQHKFGSSQVIKVDLPYGSRLLVPYALRTLASSSSTSSSGGTKSEKKKDIVASEDPFDAPTYNIPEKPVTFAEGASYSVVILVGLGVAAAAAYGVFKELIFEPKEYKIFGKALERVQSDSQVRVRIGSPVTGYGQESMNRAARQRIPNRAWTDEDGTERIEVNFYIRGPHGAGKVYTEMFKDSVDKQWKYTYLIVEIKSPSQVQLMLESYMPA